MKSTSKGKQATKGVSGAFASATALATKHANYKLTACQTVLQFFELHKAAAAGGAYYTALREILDLIPQCDWEAEAHPDGWIPMDPDGRTKSTITSSEELIERHIKPLMGYVGDADQFLRDLAAMTPEQRDEVVREAKKRNEDRAGEKAQGALGLIGVFASDGNPHGNLDNIKVTERGEGGTSAAYLAARLMKAGRDDLLRDIGPGKRFRSVRAAAIEAGIVKDVPTVRLADPAKAAASIVERMGSEWATALAAAIQSSTTGT
jgi:hypothetical protein